MNPPNRQPFVLGSGLRDVPLDVGCICPVFGREEVANPRVGRCVDDLMYLSNSAEHFLAPIPDLWAIFLLSLTPPAPPVDIGEGKFARRHDPGAFKGLLLEQLHEMNNLHQLHALDVPTRQRIFQSAMSAVDATTMDHPEGPQS